MRILFFLKKAQSLILLAAFFFPAHGMGMELWQIVQQKSFTKWANAYLYPRQALRIADKQITTRELQVGKWLMAQQESEEYFEEPAPEEHYPAEGNRIKAVNQWMEQIRCVQSLRLSMLISQRGLFKDSSSPKQVGEIGIVKSWLELSSHQIEKEWQQRIEQKQICKQIVQELIVQEGQGHAFTIAQHKHDRRQRQQELRHKQKIKLPKNPKLPKSQQRMQVAHRKKW